MTGAHIILLRLVLQCFTQVGKKPWDPLTASGPTFNKVFLGKKFLITKEEIQIFKKQTSHPLLSDLLPYALLF